MMSEEGCSGVDFGVVNHAFEGFEDLRFGVVVAEDLAVVHVLELFNCEFELLEYALELIL